jgi:nicotinamidase-related amidase
MPRTTTDLHGSAPDQADTALLLVDVINDCEFEGGERLLEHAVPMADAIDALRRRARDAGVPVVYVNDNFGRWQSNFDRIIERCFEDRVRGLPIIERLRPERDDYFVLKPKHSGFYATPLDILLQHLGARTLIITGIAADNCVMFTASDAYLRDYQIRVPADCVASIDPADRDAALGLMRRTFKADTRPSREVEL